MATLSPQLQSLLDNRLRYLPEIVGKAINSLDWSTELITIGKHYGLHIDEMEDFQAVVLKSMIGLIAPDQFESSIITSTALSPANAEKMIHDINQKILEPIHNMVMNPHQKTDSLQKSGILVEASEEVPDLEPYTHPVLESHPFEIPASPEPKLVLTSSSAVFSDYF